MKHNVTAELILDKKVLSLKDIIVFELRRERFESFLIREDF